MKNILPILLFFVGSQILSFSQNIVYYPKYDEAGYFPTSIDIMKSVGVVDGVLDIDPKGGASYRIDIKVPNGVNSVHPALSLIYNSQTGDGILGQGWSITELSQISRVPKSAFSNSKVGPVKNDLNDVFSLNYNQLLLKSGVYGNSNAKYTTVVEEFKDITQTINGIHTGFIVTDKSGISKKYGMTQNAIRYSSNNVPMIWMIEEISDPSGNKINFEYNHSDNQTRISRILYANNTCEIKFNYLIRADQSCNYESGEEFKLKFLIDNIEILNNSMLFKKYQIEYTKSSHNQSLLQNIREYGYDGVSELNPTKFCYQDPQTDYNIYEIPNGLFPAISEEVSIGDFNADGLSDIANVERYWDPQFGMMLDNSIRIWKNLSNNAFVVGQVIGPFSSPTIVHYDNKFMSSININSHAMFSKDFNGDGRDDLLLSSLGATNSGDLYLNSNNVLFSNIYSPYPTSVSVNPTPGHIFLPVNKNFLYPGDFDGNGIADFLTILGDGFNLSANYEIRFHSPGLNLNNKLVSGGGGFTINEIATSNNISVVDFDGDGKTELLMTNGSGTKIFSMDAFVMGGANYTLNLEYNASSPKNPDVFYLGDFNGDQKNDFLIENGSNWDLVYSTGKSISNPIVANINYNPSNEKITLLEANNDRFLDIIVSKNLNATSSEVRVYLGNGINFDNAIVINLNSFTLNMNNPPRIADLNGDGQMELLLFHPGPVGTSSNILKVVEIEPNNKEKLLHAIADGYGNITSIRYKNVTEGLQIYEPGMQQDVPNTGPSYHQSFPVNNVAFPMYVVNQINVPNGVGGVSSISFKYEDINIHRLLRNNLGFKKVHSTNITHDKLTTTENQFIHALALPFKITNRELSSGTIINEEQTLYNLTDLNLYGIKHFYINVASKIFSDVPRGITKTSDYSYDVYNNLIQESSNDAGIDLSTVDYIYINPIPNISSYPNRIQQKTTTLTRNGDTRSNTVDYTYDNLGRNTVTVFNPGSSNELIENYSYDGIGLVYNISTFGSGSNRIKSYIYSSDKKYLLHSSENYLLTTTYQYDLQTNLVSSITTPDCLTASYEYDKFGQLIQVNMPNGGQTLNSISWDQSFPLACYKIENSQTGKPTSISYMDKFGRQLKEKSQDFNGNWVTIDKAYDSRGNVISQSLPYTSNVNPQYKTTLYDNLKRIIEESTPSGTISYTHSYQGPNYVIQSTSSNGIVEEKTFDATDKLIITSDGGGIFHYFYDAFGNRISIKRGGVIIEEDVYNEYNQKIMHFDRSYNTLFYEYNAFNQVTKMSDGKGYELLYFYDALGRIVTRTGNQGEGATNYSYGTGCLSTKLVQTDFNGTSTSYSYDGNGNVISINSTINGIQYQKDFVYDSDNNLIEELYPSGLSIQRNYDTRGNLTQIVEPVSNTVIYSINTTNEYGRVTSGIYGNGLTESIGYNHNILVNKAVGTIFDYSLIYDNNFSNINQRIYNHKNLKEIFTYDNLNRLTSSTVTDLSGVPSHPTQNYTYDNSGSISLGRKIEDDYVGYINYDSYKFRAASVLGPNNPNDPTDPPLNISQQTQLIEYFPYNRVKKITEGNYELNVNYNESYERNTSKLLNNGVVEWERIYFENYELQQKGSVLSKIHYIYGPSGLVCMIVDENQDRNFYYTHTDHLGSICSITDNSGNVVFEQNFDAWGRRRDPNDLSYNYQSPPFNWMYRGFCNHEQLDEFGLINMNARLYDPILSQMIQPDAFLPNPHHSQGLNRYSYGYNNPLIYKDPSGNYVQYLFGAMAGGVTGYQIGKAKGATGTQLIFEYVLPGVIIGTGSAGLGGAVTGYFGNTVGGIILGGATAGFAGSVGFSMLADLDADDVIFNGIKGGMTGAMSAGISAVFPPNISPYLAGFLNGVLGAIESEDFSMIMFHGLTGALLAKGSSIIQHRVDLYNSVFRGLLNFKGYMKLIHEIHYSILYREEAGGIIRDKKFYPAPHFKRSDISANSKLRFRTQLQLATPEGILPNDITFHTHFAKPKLNITTNSQIPLSGNPSIRDTYLITDFRSSTHLIYETQTSKIFDATLENPNFINQYYRFPIQFVFNLHYFYGE